MFFDKEDVAVSILEVLKIEQNKTKGFNTGRVFNGLSFRISADAEITTETEEYHLKDNSVCFVPKAVDYTRISERDELIVVHFNILNYSFGRIECFNTENPEIKSLFEKLLECWNRKELGYRYRAEGLFSMILAECFKENHIPEKEETPIAKSLEFMRNNFTDASITMGQIAEKSFISEVYFRKIFKNIYGTSPVKYLIMLRMERAIALISTGYYNLKEVAILSGYSDYSYFSAEFKRIKGVPPSKYVVS